MMYTVAFCQLEW